jgi:hypothetical protein
MRYGLLAYATRNIGDDIQSVAARRFLPRVDLRVDREHLDRVEGDEPVKLILNGWFAHRPEHWPPAPQIEPLFISFHITRSILPLNEGGLRASDVLVRGASLEYLRRYQPIGCRDLSTVELLEAHGVDSYFSACLTLTLENRRHEREDVTYFVDVPDDVVRFVSARRGGVMRVISHEAAITDSIESRDARAETLLDRYAGAALVVTSKLHCALPCVALGTPVVFLVEDASEDRLRGLCELTRHFTAAEILSGAAPVDWTQPGPNPSGAGQLRRSLVERCATFFRGVSARSADR